MVDCANGSPFMRRRRVERDQRDSATAPFWVGDDEKHSDLEVVKSSHNPFILYVTENLRLPFEDQVGDNQRPGERRMRSRGPDKTSAFPTNREDKGALPFYSSRYQKRNHSLC